MSNNEPFTEKEKAHIRITAFLTTGYVFLTLGLALIMCGGFIKVLGNYRKVPEADFLFTTDIFILCGTLFVLFGFFSIMKIIDEIKKVF